MKTVIAAILIVFLALATVAGTTAVAAYGSASLERQLALFPDAPEDAAEEIEALQREFQKWEPWFSLVCPHTDVMHTAEYLAELEGAIQAKSAESYDAALVGMKEAAEHLRRAILPRFSDLL